MLTVNSSLSINGSDRPNANPPAPSSFSTNTHRRLTTTLKVTRVTLSPETKPNFINMAFPGRRHDVMESGIVLNVLPVWIYEVIEAREMAKWVKHLPCNVRT